MQVDRVNLSEAKDLYENSIMTYSELAIKYRVDKSKLFYALKRIGTKSRSCAVRNQLGEKNKFWKGDKASKGALHYRVKNIKGKPSLCSICGATKAGFFDWANLTGEYTNPDDYKRMCRSCHKKYDFYRARIKKSWKESFNQPTKEK